MSDPVFALEEDELWCSSMAVVEKGDEVRVKCLCTLGDSEAV